MALSKEDLGAETKEIRPTEETVEAKTPVEIDPCVPVSPENGDEA